jgi:hypothetical protein
MIQYDFLNERWRMIVEIHDARIFLFILFYLQKRNQENVAGVGQRLPWHLLLL